MAEQDKSKRKKWSKEETLLLLRCYSSRKAEFEHSRRKKFAYSNVLEDMVYQGFNDPNVTTTTLEAKIRTLLVAYKSAKDNSRRTGSTLCIAPYVAEMEEIFGDKPIISNVHTLSLGTGPIQPLQESNHLRTFAFDENSSPNASSQPLVSPSPYCSPPTAQTLSSVPSTAPCCLPPTALTPSSAPSTAPCCSPPTALTPSCSPPIATCLPSINTANYRSPPLTTMTTTSQPTDSLGTNQRSRKTAKERYYEAKLAQRQSFLNDVKGMLKDKYKRQEELEKLKMEILQRRLDDRSS